MDQRFGRQPYLPLDYVCTIHYLTDVEPGMPAFAVVPKSHQYKLIEEAHEGLSDDYCEQPIYGKAGTAVFCTTTKNGPQPQAGIKQQPWQ